MGGPPFGYLLWVPLLGFCSFGRGGGEGGETLFKGSSCGAFGVGVCFVCVLVLFLRLLWGRPVGVSSGKHFRFGWVSLGLLLHLVVALVVVGMFAGR